MPGSKWRCEVIGGPLDGTISPDYGAMMRAPRPTDVRYVSEDAPPYFDPMPIDQYRRHQTLDGNYIYTYEGFR